MPTKVINVVHTLAETDNTSKGVNYNDGISEPATFQETAGVDTGKYRSGWNKEENKENETDNTDNHNYDNHDYDNHELIPILVIIKQKSRSHRNRQNRQKCHQNYQSHRIHWSCRWWRQWSNIWSNSWEHRSGLWSIKSDNRWLWSSTTKANTNFLEIVMMTFQEMVTMTSKHLRQRSNPAWMRYGLSTSNYNLRPCQENLHEFCNDIGWSKISRDYARSKQGLKISGKARESAVSTVYRTHSRQVTEQKHPHELKRKEIFDALHYFMFLQEKHTGKIKRIGCDYWRKQRPYIQKKETSLPKVAVE